MCIKMVCILCISLYVLTVLFQCSLRHHQWWVMVCTDTEEVIIVVRSSCPICCSTDLSECFLDTMNDCFKWQTSHRHSFNKNRSEHPVYAANMNSDNLIMQTVKLTVLLEYYQVVYVLLGWLINGLDECIFSNLNKVKFDSNDILLGLALLVTKLLPLAWRRW